MALNFSLEYKQTKVPGTFILVSRYQVSGIRYLVFGITVGIRNQVPSTWYVVPGIRYQVPAIWYLKPGIWYLVPDTVVYLYSRLNIRAMTKDRVSGIWYQVPDT